MKIEEMIMAVQRQLSIEIDGRAGPQTWRAIYSALVKKKELSLRALPIDPVDDRSERNIATLLPEVQPLARSLVHKARQNDIVIKVISGTRSYEEQDALFALGRTKPGAIVTKARAGYSNHNFGLAFDVGVFEGNRYLPESPKYIAVGALGLEIGLEWGGSWKSIVDRPHFQARPVWAKELNERQMLAELRSRLENGRPLLSA